MYFARYEGRDSEVVEFIVDESDEQENQTEILNCFEGLSVSNFNDVEDNDCGYDNDTIYAVLIIDRNAEEAQSVKVIALGQGKSCSLARNNQK